MARLVSILVVLWLVYAVIGFSVARAPRADDAATTTTTSEPDPPPAVDEVVLAPDPTPEPAPLAPTDAELLTPGIYEVSTSSPLGPDAGRPGPLPLVLGSARLPRRGMIDPGLYASASNAVDCRYELWREMADGEVRVIAEEFLEAGRLLVTINTIEPDWFVSTEGCGGWYRWMAPSEPLTEALDGDYWIGDLAVGTWAVPEPCRWEKVTGFRGGFLFDAVDGGRGPGVFEVDGETLGVRIRGCRNPVTQTPLIPYDGF